MGEVRFFPGLDTKERTTIFWKIMYQQKLGAKVKMKYLQVWSRKIQYAGSLAREAHTTEYLQSKIRNAHKVYSIAKKQAWECRREFLKQLQEEAEGKEKKRIKDIRRREENKHQWRIWKMLSTTSHGAAILAVEITSQEQTIKVTEWESLEREIMHCLSKRFSLTYNNPSMNNMFTSQVGYLAEKPGATQILVGNIPGNLGLDAEARKFLSFLTLPQMRKEISGRV